MCPLYLCAGVSATLQLQLCDDTVPFGDVRKTSGNPHRNAWRALAVRDPASSKVVGGWTTVYDEGGERNLNVKQAMSEYMGVMYIFSSRWITVAGSCGCHVKLLSNVHAARVQASRSS